MQLRHRIISRTGQAASLLVAAATICGWTSVMGALAARGVDHSLLDGVTYAAVIVLGCAGFASAAVRQRSKQTAKRPENKEPLAPSATASDATNAANSMPNVAYVPKNPALNLTERACLALAQAHDLSLREREVLNLMATGITGKEIASQLTLSYNTVKSHIRHIYDKLNVHRKQDLVDLIEQQKERLA